MPSFPFWPSVLLFFPCLSFSFFPALPSVPLFLCVSLSRKASIPPGLEGRAPAGFESEDRDTIMTVTCITPPVLGLCLHTITYESYIPAKVGDCRAREGGKEMVRAVLVDNVQYLQMMENKESATRGMWRPAAPGSRDSPRPASGYGPLLTS